MSKIHEIVKDMIGKNDTKPVTYRQAWQAAHTGSWKCHGYTLEPDATCPKCGRGVL